MGENSGIAWTTHTWNPWQGCRKVSAGCLNCYMHRDKQRYGQDPGRVERSKSVFTAPLRWKQPAFVFTCSWSDWFIEDADPWRSEAWEIIRRTPHLTYQILTKRPENMASRLPADWGDGWRHVWLGVTCEDQHAADDRIPLLLRTPTAVRFVSVEPMLGPVNLPCARLDWVIVGGETGPRARPCDPEWMRSIRYQCQATGAPLFVKQMTGQAPIPPDLMIRERPALIVGGVTCL